MIEIKKGDIILVHSHNITGRIIQLGMNIERWRKLQFSPTYKMIHNHAGICTSDGYISEALATGIKTQTLEDAYKNKTGKTITIYRPDFTKEELDCLSVVSTQYEGVHYQFLNFLQYIPKIFFGIWLGKTHKQAEDILYCTEYVGLVIHKIRNYLFGKYWRTSPLDVQEYCEKNWKKIGTFTI